jgi:D-alanine-D-alanine ligase
MKQSDKIRVAVLYGGRSAEHEISLRSAANVIQYLDPTQFEVVPIGIDKQGNWFLGNEVFAKSLAQNTVSQLESGSHTWFAPEWISNSRPHLPEIVTVPTASRGPQFDVIFPVVHGTLCEDGTLQGLLEIAGLPYVGCGVLSSAMGMDKDISKRLAMLEGIRVAPYLCGKQEQWRADPEYFSRRIEEKLSYPIFVKPANAGSSIGIAKVKSKDQLYAAINEAFRFDHKILIEKALNVMELEVAVLEPLEKNASPIVSVVGEIKPRHEFYSYEAKYVDENGAELRIPAPVSTPVLEEARAIANKIFLALECEGMARVDLFLNQDDQQIYFNEVNTIPGFTQISMYPKLMAATGISYPALLTHLIQLAIKKHQNKTHLIRSYTHT